MFGSNHINDTWLLGEFAGSLPGFMMSFNKDGKILYTSDNILDYLGNTVVSLL